MVCHAELERILTRSMTCCHLQEFPSKVIISVFFRAEYVQFISISGPKVSEIDILQMRAGFENTDWVFTG